MKKIYLLLALFIPITSCEKNEEVPTYTEIQQEKIFDKNFYGSIFIKYKFK